MRRVYFQMMILDEGAVVISDLFLFHPSIFTIFNAIRIPRVVIVGKSNMLTE